MGCEEAPLLRLNKVTPETRFPITVLITPLFAGVNELSHRVQCTSWKLVTYRFYDRSHCLRVSQSQAGHEAIIRLESGSQVPGLKTDPAVSKS